MLNCRKMRRDLYRAFVEVSYAGRVLEGAFELPEEALVG